MRIISSFKDYYDGVQRLNVGNNSDNLVFIRKQEDIYDDVDHGVIGFCGASYPFVKIEVPRKDPVICYSMDEVDSFLSGELTDKQIKYYKSSKWKDKKKNKTEIPYWFWDRDDYLDVFRKTNPLILPIKQEILLDAPIVLKYKGSHKLKNGRYGYIIKYQKNPNLEKYQFFRKFPPYQAYQELRVWHSNKANPEPFVPEMSNDIKIGQHGYDKYSFRSQPKK